MVKRIFNFTIICQVIFNLLPFVKFEDFFAQDEIVFGLGAVGERFGQAGFGIIVFVHGSATVV